MGSAAQEGITRGSENGDQGAERNAQHGAATNAVDLPSRWGDLFFTVLRLTVTVVYCPCDTILPLQGDREAVSPPAEPPIRQHWSTCAAKAADAGRCREARGHGGSSREPA